MAHLQKTGIYFESYGLVNFDLLKGKIIFLLPMVIVSWFISIVNDLSFYCLFPSLSSLFFLVPFISLSFLFLFALDLPNSLGSIPIHFSLKFTPVCLKYCLSMIMYIQGCLLINTKQICCFRTSSKSDKKQQLSDSILRFLCHTCLYRIRAPSLLHQCNNNYG